MRHFAPPAPLVCLALSALLALGLLAGGSHAENLNIDLGLHHGPPSSGFGAAIHQPGVWNDIGLGTTPNLLDVSGTTTGVAITVDAYTDSGWTGAPTGDAERMLFDNCYALAGSSWSVDFTGLTPGIYDIYVYAPAHPSVSSGALMIGGGPRPDLPGTWAGSFVENTNYAHQLVVVSWGSLHVTGASATSLHGPAGMQLVEVRPSFNLDVGLHWGAPSSSFGGAAAQPGAWNEIGLGTAPSVLDVFGRTLPMTVQLNAFTDSGWTGAPGSSDAEFLVADNAFASSGTAWQITLTPLANGNYWVYLYAPANTTVDSGTLDVNGAALSAIPGTYSGSFVEGTNYIAVPARVSGHTLTISGQNPGALSGLAGLQMKPRDPLVPALAPVSLAVLMLALAAAGVLAAAARRRRAYSLD